MSNYQILLIDKSQLSEEQWLDLSNANSTITQCDYEHLSINPEFTADVFDTAVKHNEAFKQELRDSEMEMDSDPEPERVEADERQEELE